MTPPELQALRRLLFFSASEAARWVAADADRPRGVEDRTWHRWEAGKVPIPPNVAARVLELVEWRGKSIAAAAQQLPGSGPPLRLLAYAEADDWRGAPVLWRPAQSAAAQLLASWPGRVELVAFDALAFGAWRRARHGADDDATRQAWAATLPGPVPARAGPPGEVCPPLAPIEGSMPTPSTNRGVRIAIPDGVQFADLKLARDPVTLEVEFDWAPIEKICAASGLDVALFRDQHEDHVAGLIQQWYLAHLAAGGAPDAVQEQLRAEVEAEAAAGGQAGVISHGGGLQ